MDVKSEEQRKCGVRKSKEEKEIETGREAGREIVGEKDRVKCGYFQFILKENIQDNLFLEYRGLQQIQLIFHNLIIVCFKHLFCLIFPSSVLQLVLSVEELLSVYLLRYHRQVFMSLTTKNNSMFMEKHAFHCEQHYQTFPPCYDVFILRTFTETEGAPCRTPVFMVVTGHIRFTRMFHNYLI